MKKILSLALLVMFGGTAILTWTGAAAGEEGQKVFSDKCAPCHGEKGKGDGPLASTFDPKPRDFCVPEFWQGNVDKKITDAITKGKDQMIPVDLKPDQIKVVIEYVKSSCKK